MRLRGGGRDELDDGPAIRAVPEATGGRDSTLEVDRVTELEPCMPAV